MIATRTRYTTVEEYDALPLGPPYFQLIDSELVMSPSPIPAHQDASLNLVINLGLFLRTLRIGRLHLAPFDVRLDGRNIYQPNLFVVLNGNPGTMDNNGFHGAPDLVIEFLSPSTARYDHNQKKDTYAKVGVKEYWIIEPTDRTVECYRNTGQEFALTSILRSEGMITSALLEGFSIGLAELFEGT